MFGLDWKSMAVGVALGMFVVPRVMAMVSYKSGSK